jgi:DHA2 family multidrug resistance protein
LSQVLIGRGIDPYTAHQQAIAIIDGAIRRQANLMAFGDCFFVFSFVLAIGCLAVLFLKKGTLGTSHEMH